MNQVKEKTERMKAKAMMLFALLAAGLASCSQDDALQTTVNDNDGSVSVTLSATIDHGVQTRATSTTDDDATRCLLQIIEDDGTTTTKREVQTMTLGTDGSYTASAMLNPNNTYTFLFWADDGNYTATDLEAVTIADEARGAGIAWYGKAEWSSSESTTIEAELKHAVTKVTLQSTTEVPTTTTATISGVKEYSTFNVSEGKVTGEATTNLFTHSGNGKGQTGDVFSFYALVSDETQNLKLQTGDQPEVPIPNVPLAQNKHVILSGDVAGSGLTEYTFTATIDTDWASTETLIEGLEIDENGTYIVSTAAALQAWASHVNQRNWDTDCTLAANITLTGENNWTPVGTNIYAYTGTFDGAGHIISGMNISGDQHTQGFIGHLSGTVKNLTITEASVSGSNSIGGIVGITDAGSNIIGCTFSGDISASVGSVGGIVGIATGCTITGCSASGTVSTIQSSGGIVGYSNNSNITACWSTAEVTASLNSSAGCIVGNSMQSTYTACYWGNTTTETGIGNNMADTGSPIYVDGTWNTAMEAMNAQLTDSGFRWELNTGIDTEKVPLVLVSE